MLAFAVAGVRALQARWVSAPLVHTCPPLLPSPLPPCPLQALKQRISCYGRVIAVEGSTATVQLALVLPDGLWAGHHRWAGTPAAAQLFTHLVPAAAAHDGPAPRQGEEEGSNAQQPLLSYWQQLQRQLPGVRQPPAGTDPFR